jgi:hypothetical protein
VAVTVDIVYSRRERKPTTLWRIYLSPSSDGNWAGKTNPIDPLENIVSITGECRLLSLTVPLKTETFSVTGTMRFLSA